MTPSTSCVVESEIRLRDAPSTLSEGEAKKLRVKGSAMKAKICASSPACAHFSPNTVGIAIGASAPKPTSAGKESADAREIIQR